MRSASRRAPGHVLAALLPLALVLLLAGCTLTVRPGSSTSAVHSQGVIVWAHLGLSFHFPGVVVITKQSSPHHFDTRFRSDASLGGVYGDVDDRMRSEGWHRTRFGEHGDRIDAVYVRDGEEARVSVLQEGRSGNYRLHIDD